MEIMLIYLINLCREQAIALVAAQAIIEEQASSLADTDTMLACLDNDLDCLDKEVQAIETEIDKAVKSQ